MKNRSSDIDNDFDKTSGSGGDDNGESILVSTFSIKINEEIVIVIE